jgi:predicted patatin/cPLA2 family phospholipase
MQSNTAVMRVILDRLSSGSQCGHREDPHRVALVIEGGAMRGVVSAGMVSALHFMKATRAFDAVFGSSAGAVNGAYFLAGQAPYGTSIYYEDINNRQFLFAPRLILNRPGMCLSYLFDEVVRHRKPLDTSAVIASPIPLWVVATSVSDCAPVAWSGFKDGDELIQAMWASCQFPYLSGGPRVFRGGRYFDGGILSQVPFRPALAQGFTHVLALVTGSQLAHPLEPLASALQALFMRRYGSALSDAVASRARRNREDRLKLRDFRPLGDDCGGPHMWAITTGARGYVARTETRMNRLIAAGAAGFRAVYEAFGHSAASIVPVMFPFERSGRPLKDAAGVDGGGAHD